MESMILRSTNGSGAGASGVYTAHPGAYFYLQSIMFDLPISGVLSNASVTLSGAVTGAKTFNDNVVLNLAFKPNEDVYVTTSNFLTNYGVILNYIQVGEGDSYMTTDRTRSNIFGYATPWRFRA